MPVLQRAVGRQLLDMSDSRANLKTILRELADCLALEPKPDPLWWTTSTCAQERKADMNLIAMDKTFLHLPDSGKSGGSGPLFREEWTMTAQCGCQDCKRYKKAWFLEAHTFTEDLQ